MLRLFRAVIVFAITLEARAVLKKYRPDIVAVTGSVGKTSTKDAIYTVLREVYFVRKSEKSFNSEIGIPLAILGCPNAWNNPLRWLRNLLSGLGVIFFSNHYPKWLVLEVGADRPGDIKKIASWMRPSVVVMTWIPAIPVHVEFFKTPADLVVEKSHLLAALKEGGVAVMCDDDETVRNLALPLGSKRISFGFNHGADFLGANESVLYEEGRPAGMSFRIDYRGGSVPMILRGVLGRQHLYPALAAAAVGVTRGLTLVAAAQALQTHEPPPGRMRLILGKNGSTIIDDSYNSSPKAAEEALRVLEGLTTSGRKIAILGDMLELGSFSPEEHRRIGVIAASSATELWTVGVRAKMIGESAHAAGLLKKHIRHFDASLEAGVALAKTLEEGDVVLVKGSQSIRMERVVAAAMQNPAAREKLLVRQEKEWKKR